MAITKKKLRSPIYYFGGKGNMVNRILPILEAISHKQYVEPFGGGASLLLSKSPASIETYNDIDSTVCDFFRVISDPDLFKQFYDRVVLIPHSRELFDEYRTTWRSEKDTVVRTVKWYVTNRQSYNPSKEFAGWLCAYRVKSRNSWAQTWINTLKGLPEVHARLQGVQIEHDTWQKILERYDDPDTLFYCDPPYILDTRRGGGYPNEMSNDDHRELVEALLKVKAKVVLSGYEHSIYQPLLDAGWRIIRFPTHSTRTVIKTPRVECVYVKPDLDSKT